MPASTGSSDQTQRLPLTDRQRAALWRYLRVLGASACDADDLTQEACVVALRREDFDASSPAGVFAFLRTTARHLFLRANRHRVGERELAEADAVWDARCPDGTGDDYTAALRDCVAALPARARELLSATYAEGLGREAVGARLGLGADGVKSALRRLRAGLHD
ncbi:MAG: hypothetical protein KDE27_18045, partial [Planctomycetes bacterium]|nr:hypothetical protein [Planctomycetota bacterium]